MGYRMHVAMGWKLNVSDLDTQPFDDFSYHDEGQVGKFLEDAQSFSITHRDIPNGRLSHPKTIGERPPAEFSDFVIKPDGLPHVMLFVPPSFRHSWIRANDDLDCAAYEAYVGPGGEKWMEPECVPVPGNLFPFPGLMRASPSAPLGFERYDEPLWASSPDAADKIPYAPPIIWHAVKHTLLTPPERTTELFLSLRPSFLRWWA